MEGCNGSLSCNITIERYDGKQSSGAVTSIRNGRLSLWRNEFKEIMLSVESGKQGKQSSVQKKYVIYDIRLHCKFLKDGKSSLTLPNHNIRLLLSNCPPQALKEFFKLLTTKLAHFKTLGKVSESRRLAAGLTKVVEEISPLNKDDINAVNAARQQLVQGGGNTQNLQQQRKRKLPFQDRTNQTAAKKPSLDATTKKKPPAVLSLSSKKLNEEQMHVLGVIKKGRNIFISGGAGTGKSFLLRHVLGMLPPTHTIATASTGIAACHIGGITLHSFAGIGTGQDTIENCVARIKRQSQVLKRWRTCKYLIVDEISMVSSEFFDKLERVAQLVRGSNDPFAGIQLVLCGDFFQLPPVCKGNMAERRMCFQGKAWARCDLYCWELKKVYRQVDTKFIDILQDIRLGRCDAKTTAVLRATRNNKLEKGDIIATRLCTHREQVDQINTSQLEKLQTKHKSYHGRDNSPAFSDYINKLLPDTREITLKVGAQVMLTKNLDSSRGLVNGARGVVTGFTNTGDPPLPIVKFLSGLSKPIGMERWIIRIGEAAVIRKQLPLKLAWAISIHKSQGMSIDCVEMSLGNVFENGQAYVALSRATSLKGLRVLDFDSSCVRSDVEVLRFYRKLRQQQSCYVY